MKKERVNKIIKEACVESLDEAIAAESSGADRIELCSRLDLDGLTPDEDLIKACLDKLKIPIKVMIRPRSGDFIYTTSELKEIYKSISLCKSHNISEIVFGAETINYDLDLHIISEIAVRAYPMPVTIHKVIDRVRNPILDILKLKHFRNVKSILSSGQAYTATEGIENLLKMKAACANRFTLIAAGKITAQNIDELHSKLDLKEYHGKKIVTMNI